MGKKSKVMALVLVAIFAILGLVGLRFTWAQQKIRAIVTDPILAEAPLAKTDLELDESLKWINAQEQTLEDMGIWVLAEQRNAARAKLADHKAACINARVCVRPAAFQKYLEDLDRVRQEFTRANSLDALQKIHDRFGTIVQTGRASLEELQLLPESNSSLELRSGFEQILNGEEELMPMLANAVLVAQKQAQGDPGPFFKDSQVRFLEAPSRTAYLEAVQKFRADHLGQKDPGAGVK